MDLQKEKMRLSQAVDFFANDMKARLFEQAESGYTGWDKEYPTDDLWDEIKDDAENERELRSVDIANRAMMIWYRIWGKSVIKEAVENPTTRKGA